MVTGSFEPALLRFGLFELDPKSGELRKAGVEINLPPQPAKVLVLLATRPEVAQARFGLMTTLQELEVATTRADWQRGVTKATIELN